MIIDCHTHIFPDRIRKDREDYFKGEPGFRNLYGDPDKGRMVGADEIVATMDEQGVDKSVVFGFPWRNQETTELHNTYVLESVNRYPDRLIGLCCLDPFVADPVAEIERCIEGGLKGVGELAFYDRGLEEEVIRALEPIMNFCCEADLPVMLHANEPVGHQYPGKAPMTLAQIAAFLKRFPDNKIILAHWGGGLFLFHLMKKGVKELLKNAYFDTAASPYLYDNRIYKTAADIVGVEKILFGSDYPLLKPQRYFDDMERSGLMNSHLAVIKGTNAARLFKTREE